MFVAGNLSPHTRTAADSTVPEPIITGTTPSPIIANQQFDVNGTGFTSGGKSIVSADLDGAALSLSSITDTSFHVANAPVDVGPTDILTVRWSDGSRVSITVPEIQAPNFHSAVTQAGEALALGWVISGSVTVPALTNGLLLVKISQNLGNTGGVTGAGVTSVSLGATPLVAVTSAGPSTETSPYARCDLYKLVNPPAGTFTLTTTIAAGTQVAGTRHTAIGIEFFDGAHQTTPLGTAVTGTGTTDNPHVAVTSAAGQLVTDMVAGRAVSGTVAGSGQTQSYAVSQGGGGGDAIRGNGNYEAGAASVVMDRTGVGVGDSEWSMIGIPIKPA